MTDWTLAPRAPQAFFDALRDLHPLTAQILFARGYLDPAQAHAFLSFEGPRVDPFSLRDMRLAVERILAAVQRGESVAVYGDYDCDGVTASALMMRTLRALGANAQVYIPNRFDEGYGLSSEALDVLKTRGAQLVITVDCGTRSMREALHAREIGLDLIITDHHELEDGAIPKALAVINPQRPDCTYGFKKLAGVGVALRVAQALLRTARTAGLAVGSLSESALLDLVAIGTVADVVELRGENRRLVNEGLKRINGAPCPGLQALIKVAGLHAGALTARSIGFTLGPRLNAAGRLETALDAYHLLECSDEDAARASELAGKLDAQNSARQTLTASTARDAEIRALSTVKDGHPPPLLFAASDQYNVGVIGLAASRLMEKHYRPAVVVSVSGTEARGSCRSVNGFDITHALDECRDLFTKHGGHAAAAGFTLPTGRVNELRGRLSDIVAQQQPQGGWQRVISADAELELDQLDWQVLSELQQLEPHGAGNPKPAFVARSARVQRATRMGKAEGSALGPHLKLILIDRRGFKWDAVGWHMGEKAGALHEDDSIDLAFQLGVNEWNGKRQMQLEIMDFRAADKPA